MLMTSDSLERKRRRRRRVLLLLFCLAGVRFFFLYNIFFRYLITEPLRIDIMLINEGFFFYTLNYMIVTKDLDFFLICPIIIRHGVFFKDYNIRVEYTRINQWWRFLSFFILLYHTRRLLRSNVYICIVFLSCWYISI
jgi:hypothetical protein